MRALLLASALAACAPAASTVRDGDGNPVPTHARLDDEYPAQRVHCPDGTTYTVVEGRTRALASWRDFTPTPVTDTAALCAKIRRY